MGFENTHKDAHRVFPKRVFFTGSTALVKGQGVCYDADRGTATDAEGERMKYVELPSSSNNLWFAGVTARGYGAKTNGQWVEIYEPGSVCQVAVGVDTTVDSTIMTCSANSVDAGRFTQAGFPGRGTAVALQTNASGVLASSYDASGALDATGLIITDTAAFAGLTAGTTYDIYVLAGEDDATNVVTGLKTTGTYTTDNTFTLTSAASDGGTMEVSYYIQDGNQTCLAYLMDGEESGLQQVYQVTNGANTGLMAAGVNYIHGGANLSADATETLADGSRIGQRCGIKLMAANTANDYLLTVSNATVAGVAGIDSVVPIFVEALTFAVDGANDSVVLKWGLTEWAVESVSGALVMASS